MPFVSFVIALRSLASVAKSNAEALSSKIRISGRPTKARAFVQQQSSFGGRRGSMPVQYVLQAVSIEKLQKVLPEFLSQDQTLHCKKILNYIVALISKVLFEIISPKRDG